MVEKGDPEGKPTGPFAGVYCDVLNRCLLRKQEVDEEGSGSYPHERLNLLAATSDQGNDNVGNEAHADAVGNGVRKGDACNDHE